MLTTSCKGDKEAAESGAFYARIRHERYLNEQAILKGQSTSSLLMPGWNQGSGRRRASSVPQVRVLITGVTASAARDRSYELTFTAIPYSERYGYRPALIPPPGNGRHAPGADQHGEKTISMPISTRTALPGQPRL